MALFDELFSAQANFFGYIKYLILPAIISWELLNLTLGFKLVSILNLILIGLAVQACIKYLSVSNRRTRSHLMIT